MSDALADRFKAGFRRYPTGVAIVAASTQAGPVGVTISSLSSVSANPPLLSFSVSRAGRSGPAIVGCGELAVHVLDDDQATLAAAFAHRTAPRFTDEQGWTFQPGRPPVLDRAAASFYGRVTRVVPAGEAWLVLLEVDTVDLSDAGASVRPLLHHDRRYWSLGTAADALDGVVA
ncbi:flavin reductase (DIM6/NTAB) family NADH-FMN oxidoreductase RutF [Nocardioides albertanoniae]|uniref:Flavin reductase (DIM6/NTAB) family NADH-FMN oxidoreductase RutF n=1 Tax=Nocardioides albertanoniae TaxID=1175486 RepID=A0A543ACR1_9ACTN|nr:flavin reductase family protein [Nocardioides albertanoniae]TQL70371.1 flavin reductase (DIM6/NTAB) family NADH-FMN oxidoreductase RutF [Nocardioides albertanoniae]